MKNNLNVKMKEVLVLSTNFIGFVEIPDLNTYENIMIFEDVKSKVGIKMDIMYFQNMEYGVEISKEIVKQFQNK